MSATMNLRKLQTNIYRQGASTRKMGYTIPIRQVQYDAADNFKETPKRSMSTRTLYRMQFFKMLTNCIVSRIAIENVRWNTHVSKANRTLGFLRRKLYSCPKDANKSAYKVLVRQVLEHGSYIWNHT